MCDDRDDERGAEPQCEPAEPEGEDVAAEVEEPPRPEPNVDAELLVRWRRGDERAGNQLYRRMAPMVIAYFRTHVRGDEAKDLTQETFLALVRGRDRIRDVCIVRSYVYGTAENILCRYIGHKQRTQV
ncbi:MAG: hypothetical protein KC431_28730, partial [Myxococcales bacterium]|nr:hypothetical protein [Myxococcales bacterium]